MSLIIPAIGDRWLARQRVPGSRPIPSRAVLIACVEWCIVHLRMTQVCVFLVFNMASFPYGGIEPSWGFNAIYAYI